MPFVRIIVLVLLAVVAPSVLADDDCITVDTSIDGASLEGHLWPSQEITVYGLGCGMPERYDYVVFHVTDGAPQVIKQLWGLPGDTLQVTEKNRFLINGVEAKTPFGKPYILLGSARTRFKKLEGTLKGFLVLGHPGSVDSTRLGLIPKRDILGYVPKAQAD